MVSDHEQLKEGMTTLEAFFSEGGPGAEAGLLVASTFRGKPVVGISPQLGTPDFPFGELALRNEDGSIEYIDPEDYDADINGEIFSLSLTMRFKKRTDD